MVIGLPLRVENRDGAIQEQPVRSENLGTPRPEQPPQLSGAENLGVERPVKPLNRGTEKLGAARLLQPLGRGANLGAARQHRDRHFSGLRGGVSDDNALKREILDTHQLIDESGFASKPVLNIIEVIFSNANSDLPHVVTDHQEGTVVPKVVTADEKALLASLGELFDLPTKMMSSIASEILLKWLNGGDEHKTAIKILQIVRHYDWDEKVVLAVATFAVAYGEFRIVSQQYPTNPLAKAIGVIKQFPEILDHQFQHGAWKPKLEAIYNLMRAMLDVTNSILSYYDLPKDYFTIQTPEIMAVQSHISLAVYWTIRSVIVCSIQIMGISGTGHEGISEAWDLSSLAHKLNSINSHIDDLLCSLRKIIERIRDEEAFDLLVRILETSHVDNSKSLGILFPSKDNLPLYDCFHKRKASSDDLRQKIVVLFITEVEIPTTEYLILHQMYHERRENPTKTESKYEVIWVPVMDMRTDDNLTKRMDMRTDENLKRFYNTRDEMLWYSVDHPSVVSPGVIRYFRERCNFNRKPILMVLDTSGKKVHDNAIHMMCIWGSPSYPFSHSRERLLWDEETWRLDLLADAVDPHLLSWFQEGRYIFLYGGEDIDWIRKFTKAAKETARDSRINLGILYVGKNKAKERITRNIINIIEKEDLSNAVEWNMIGYFWERIESMWYSKGNHSKGMNVKNDPIMLGIIAILSFGSSAQGWALIGRGSDLVYSNGENMYRALDEHPEWKPRENEVGFLTALGEYLGKVHRQTPHHCTSLILPTATKEMPDTVACSECGRLMERYTMFRCCTD